MRTIILGLGNPILGDDSIGIRIARALQNELNPAETTVMETSAAGIDFLDLLAGYDRAIIVDAIKTGEGKAGQIYRFEPDMLETTRYANTPHDINFVTAIELGKRLNFALPGQIVIFGIEVEKADSFGEECTPEVRRAIPACINMISQELNSHSNTQLVSGSYCSDEPN